MKKFYAALSIIIFGSISAFAQQQPPQSDKANYGSYSFAPAREEFSIESSPVAFADRNPATTDANRFTIDNAGRRYLAATQETYFYIFSDAAKKPEQYKIVSDFLKYFQPSATGVYIGDTAGEKYAFADTDGFFHKVLIVKTARRTYVFQTVSQSENSADAERFFAAIKFDRKLPAEQTVAPEEKIDGETRAADAKDVKNIQAENSGTGNGIGSGRGSGSGNGNGAGIGGGQNGAVGDSANAGQTSPLSLQARPKPGYTDFARFYEITGTVRARVTFLATGEIGDVTLVTKLPFGLSNSAIAAARAIQFTPARKNGQPYTVVKMVEYSFTIY